MRVAAVRPDEWRADACTLAAALAFDADIDVQRSRADVLNTDAICDCVRDAVTSPPHTGARRSFAPAEGDADRTARPTTDCYAQTATNRDDTTPDANVATHADSVPNHDAGSTANRNANPTANGDPAAACANADCTTNGDDPTSSDSYNSTCADGDSTTHTNLDANDAASAYRDLLANRDAAACADTDAKARANRNPTSSAHINIYHCPGAVGHCLPQPARQCASTRVCVRPCGTVCNFLSAPVSSPHSGWARPAIASRLRA
jgi:hypothetical protein